MALPGRVRIAFSISFQRVEDFDNNEIILFRLKYYGFCHPSVKHYASRGEIVVAGCTEAFGMQLNCGYCTTHV